MLAALFAVTACGSEPAGDAAPHAEAVAVKVAQSDLGPILVDQAGRTLYAFTKDENKPDACDADCIAVWPAFTSESTVEAGEGADAKLIGTTEETQAVYGKWRMYYYVGDAAAGDLNGQGVDDEWFAVAPDGGLVRAIPSS
ncbi:MAG: hypothetical protein QOF58_1418 [Pseudonocardiales bacterium]|jgi:predicted lipoprotein with Yx(FWY)xxD motif|nr:hypothetical protein [Pseudonocardiales bacterium]